MASDGKTHIIRARTFTEAVNKAKSKFGSDFSIVTRRDVREEGGLFKKLTGGKLDPPEVELEVAPVLPKPPGAPAAPAKPAAQNPLIKTYTKALERAEKHSSDTRMLMAASARPFADVGEAATGVAGRLDEFQKTLEKSDKANSALREYLMEMFSLQARGGLPAVGRELVEVFRGLVSRDVDDALARDMVEHIQRANPGIAGGEEITEVLRRETARRIPSAGPILMSESGPTVMALVGPSGTGKSTTLVKLAIDYTMRQNRLVGLINEDMRRPGADSQLINISKIINVPVVTTREPGEIADAVRSMSGRDLILVDTAGRSPRDAKDIERLGENLRAAGVRETHLTLAAPSSGRTMKGAALRFAPTGFDRLIVTKLDEWSVHGVILNLAANLAHGLSYVTDGPDYMRPIRAADSQWLADLALGLVDVETEESVS